MKRSLVQALTIGALCALAACGGGDAVVGGTVSGLPGNSSVTLQLNGAGDLAVAANGSFSFASTLATGSTYTVTVLNQPVGASCSVANASGTIDTYGSDVSTVAVTCVSTASIAGTVTGLSSGRAVTLSNGSVSLALAANGAFAFPGVLADGTAYNVVVAVQPAGQTCTVANGAGSVVSGAQTAIVASCT